jgi:energy-coupling factor transport system ATP-binding protein
MSQAMIDIRGLQYSYPQQNEPALRGIDWQVAAGEFVLVTGPSGAGKSTLLRCLNGLVPHFNGGTIAGQVWVNGLDVIAASPTVMSQHVGFVLQNPEAQAVLDVVEAEIAFGLENTAVPRPEMQQRVHDVLNWLDLTHLRQRQLHTLSGGERQRVAIATALALRPQVLVLDEPTSQLDPQSAEEVLQALVRLNQALGLTIILSEHRLARILPYAHRMVVVEESVL